MRILFLSHYFAPEGNAPASRTYENCKRWVREGHRVTVVTCAPNMPSGVVYPGYRNRWRQTETIDGIEVVRVWTYIAANRGTTRRILNYLSYLFSATLCALFLPRPDVVIATSPQFFCGWTGVLVSRLRRLPFVLEIRDIWPESISAVGAMGGRWLLRLLERLERWMYAAADHIVTVGDGYRQRLLARDVASKKMTVIMNGVDREVFSPRPSDVALRIELGFGDRFVCSYSGTIGMACALDVVLRAAEILLERGRDDIVFALVGDGAVREDLEGEARRRSLTNVVFTGRLPKERMPAVLASSDVCFVHLSGTELFRTVMPSKLIEAGGMARPVINGVDGFAAAWVETAGAGINVEPENEEELVDAVERLAGDENLRRTYGESNYRYVLEHHDRDYLAVRYLELLDAVLADRAASA